MAGSVRTPCRKCGALSDGPLCATHRTTRARGYGGNWGETRRAILDRDRWTCRYCGRRATTVDHVVPKRYGGGDDAANLVAACLSCNSRKQTSPSVVAAHR